MKINISQCLELFDERHPEHKGHSTGIIGLIGEDLCAGAFESYMRSQENDVVILDGKFQAVNFRNGAGPRLDRWFVSKKKKIIYQCEIKNWCSWATNGVDIRQRGVDETAIDYLRKLRTSEFEGNNEYGKASKVLVEMKKPSGYENYNIEPLLILWWPISNGGSLPPYFSVKVSELNLGREFYTSFKNLNIFSTSLYLRKNQNMGNIIEFDMPNVQSRTKILRDLGVFL